MLEVECGRPGVAARILVRALALREEIEETGNALITRAWLALAHLKSAEPALAQARMHEVLAQVEAEGYGGNSPQQELWWAAYQVWKAAGERERAGQALGQAHQLVTQQAERIGDSTRRRSFLERVPVNRKIEGTWELEKVES